MKSKKCKGCVHFFPKGTTPYSYDVCNFMLIGKGVQTFSECPNGKPQYREYKEENQMTQEEKQLLLKDLCARLPYGVMCKLSVKDVDISITEKLELGGLEHFIYGTMDVKPYLRPMSSMTDDEINELDEVCDGIFNINDTNIEVLSMLGWVDSFENILKGIDWFNAHHFDYRGLIDKGLALEAPERMYKTK